MSRLATAIRHKSTAIAAVVVALAAVATVPSAAAQHGLYVSAASDFSSQDRLFSASDVIHIKVVPGTRIDLTTVTESEFELEAVRGEDEIEGVLEIRDDGSFVGRVAVSELEGDGSLWYLRVSIEDAFDNEYTARTALIIRGQAGDSETFRVHGFLEDVTETSITVSGRDFALTDETEVHLDGDADAELDDLVGQRILVVAGRGEDGTATALQIFSNATSSTVRIVGRIRHIGTASITIDETSFAVTDQTTIQTWFGAALSLEDLAVGSYALVVAERTDAGWVAVNIVARTGDVFPRDEDEHEIEGYVVSVTESTITVADLTLVVTDDTEIEGAERLADVEVGTYVEITFVAGEDGDYVAVSIEVEDDEGEDGDEDDENEIEVEGVITALSDHSVTVEGIEIIITDETEIEADDDEISLDALYTGLYVEAEGRVQNDGSVVATKVKVKENDDDRDRFSVHGEIAAIEGSAVTVGETTFFVTESTRIRGERGAELDLGDVEVGMFARARLETSAGGDLVAVELKVEHRFESEDVTIAGRIEAVSSAHITVHGITFQITEDTDIENVHGESVTAEQLAAGEFALVGGERTESGRHVAFEIRVRSRIHHEGGYGGVVSDVSDTSISVHGATFALSADTIVKGVDSVADISVGDLVRLRYRVLGDGSRLAIRIRVHADVAVDTELSGIVEDAASGVVNVAGVEVFLTAATRVHDERGQPIAGSSLEAGQMVTVSGTSTADGVVAASVNVAKAVVVAGTVLQRTAEGLVIANNRYHMDDETLIVGRSNAELQAGQLESGAFVEIIAVEQAADQTADDVLYAERVLVMKTNEGTASEDEPSIATSFRLEQNYPNPFNPSTTIRFEVGPLGDARVSLTIFDVLGREVRTLVDASLSPGVHSYTWDGTAAGGRPAASGIYLYRLEIGRQSATRSMTLVK